jgi:hypothetical protein
MNTKTTKLKVGAWHDAADTSDPADSTKQMIGTLTLFSG